MNWEPSRNLFPHHLPSILHGVVDAGSLSGLWIWTSSAVSCGLVCGSGPVLQCLVDLSVDLDPFCSVLWTCVDFFSFTFVLLQQQQLVLLVQEWNLPWLLLDSEWVQAKWVLPDCHGGCCRGVLTELKMMICCCCCCCCWGPLAGLFSRKRTMGEQLRSILKSFSRLDATNKSIHCLLVWEWQEMMISAVGLQHNRRARLKKT